MFVPVRTIDFTFKSKRVECDCEPMVLSNPSVRDGRKVSNKSSKLPKHLAICQGEIKGAICQVLSRGTQ